MIYYGAKRLRHKQEYTTLLKILFIPFPFCFHAAALLKCFLFFHFFFYKTIFFHHQNTIKQSFFKHLKFHVMEIIGRITADATVSETKAGKKVVNFSIAINDTYNLPQTMPCFFFYTKETVFACLFVENNIVCHN